MKSLPLTAQELLIPSASVVRVVLADVLHRHHGHVVRQVIPKEILLAAGVGAAGWDELREGWAHSGVPAPSDGRTF